MNAPAPARRDRLRAMLADTPWRRKKGGLQRNVDITGAILMMGGWSGHNPSSSGGTAMLSLFRSSNSDS